MNKIVRVDWHQRNPGGGGTVHRIAREDAMAELYPGSMFRPLGAQTEERLTNHAIICVHTMVGYLTSTDKFFRTYNGDGYDGTESHFGIGGIWGPDLGGNLDGAVWQWQDLNYRADANLEGNWHVISIETADNAPTYPQNILPWTSRQCHALVALISWLCRRYSIPPILIPDTRPAQRGLAYHAQGAAEHITIPGQPTEWWSTYHGKVCPGPVRTAQFKQVIIPQVQNILFLREGSADMFILRCDGKTLLLVCGNRRIGISNADRSDLLGAGVPEYNLTQAPDVYSAIVNGLT